MKYLKPVVFELGMRVQRADGQVSPNACVSGPAATGGDWTQTCGTGTSADWACNSGSGVSGSGVSCVPGGAASDTGDCLSGSSVAWYCEAGSSGTNEPIGCIAGPSYVNG